MEQLCFYTKHEQELVDEWINTAKEIVKRPIIEQYYVGQCFIANGGHAFKVLKVNKKSIKVYRIGMCQGGYTTEDHPQRYVMAEERIDLYKLDEIRAPKEITLHEAALGTYATILQRHENKRQMAADKVCAVGSRKYNGLLSGKNPPRVGDFIKSKTTGLGGFVIDSWVRMSGVSGVLVNADETETFVAKDDIVWIAPYEWEDK